MSYFAEIGHTLGGLDLTALPNLTDLTLHSFPPEELRTFN